MKIKTIIFAVLTVLWCAVIFTFSSQDADTSSDTSGSLIATVCDMIVPEFDSFSGQQRDDFVENLQFYVRKAAHFTAYALLGLLAYQSLDVIKKKRFRALTAALFAMLYACSDEFHQSFVPGRSPEVRDVCIDTTGAVLGIALSAAASAIAVKIRQRKIQKERG